METEGEERVRACESLKQLEDAAIILSRDARSHELTDLADDVPRKLSAILHSMTTIPSRDDAERLLEAGVMFWNAVIALEGKEESRNVEALVKVRHVAADCIYMAITVLGGISARFDIDEVSLLKFYTAVGRKYATDLSDLEMASVCFKKAFEFGKSAKAIADDDGNGSPRSQAFSKAMFDLLLGSAEAAWERGDAAEAESMVADARKFLGLLPGEVEYLSSVEFNIGLHAYQQKEIDKALQWLQWSMRSRRSRENQSRDVLKEAKTARLMAVCYIAQQKYTDARGLLEEAEGLCHDPSGAYLLLKVAVLSSRSEDILPLLRKNLEDPVADVEVCVASVSLLVNSRRISEAVSGYECLWNKFLKDPEALVRHIGFPFVESLCSVGKVDRALEILDKCFINLGVVFSDNEDMKKTWYIRYGNTALKAGAGLADRKCYQSAALLLDWAIDRIGQSSYKDKVLGSNEASIRRLVASCSLCMTEELQKDRVQVKKYDAGSGEPLPCPLIPQFRRVALKHALQSVAVDPDDFGGRLLVFRAYLALGEPEKAAEELQRASSEIFEFDVGALAAAACSAKDVAATDAVLAALRCILRVANSSSTGGTGAHPGFYGTVLCAAVEIIIDQDVGRKGGGHFEGEASSSVSRGSGESEKNRDHTFVTSIGTLRKLSSTMTIGREGIRRLQIDAALGHPVSTEADAVLSFLVDVAWNAGRDAAIKDVLDLCWELFDLAHDFCSMRKTSLQGLQTKKICRLMAANALIRSSETLAGPTCIRNLEAAKEKLCDVRQIVEQVLQKSHSSKEASVLALVATLEARCLSSLGDSFGLHTLVTEVSSSWFSSSALMDQLASICYNAGPIHASMSDESTFRDNVLDSCVFCLNCSLEGRLSISPTDLPHVAALFRELIKIELSRRTENAYPIAAKAVGLFQETYQSSKNGADSLRRFPADEGRWLTAISWETSQMLYRTGKNAEAQRWASLACRAAECDIALASYLPRIQQFAREISE